MSNPTTNTPEKHGTYAPNPWRRFIISITRSMPESWLGRRLSSLFRRLAFAPKSMTMDLAVEGANFRLNRTGNLCEKRLMFTPQFFDGEERAELARYIKENQNRPFVFLDIGSNIGAYALMVAAQTGPDARIYAFEPQPHIFERLSNNIAFNTFKTITPKQLALADSDASMTLYIEDKNFGESSLKQTDGDTDKRQVEVTTMRLTSFAKAEDITYISAMKLDVEGAEDLILSPFFKDADDSLLPGFMIIENSDQRWTIDIIALAHSRGYQIARKTRMNLILRR